MARFKLSSVTNPGELPGLYLPLDELDERLHMNIYDYGSLLAIWPLISVRIRELGLQDLVVLEVRYARLGSGLSAIPPEERAFDYLVKADQKWICERRM